MTTNCKSTTRPQFLSSAGRSPQTPMLACWPSPTQFSLDGHPHIIGRRILSSSFGPEGPWIIKDRIPSSPNGLKKIPIHKIGVTTSNIFSFFFSFHFILKKKLFLNLLCQSHVHINTYRIKMIIIFYHLIHSLIILWC